MNRASLRSILPIVFAIAFFALPAQSCAPEWPVAVFTKQYGPDEPYLAYAAGRLGVPQPGYRARNLAIAYDWLSGHGLPAAQQKQAAKVNHDISIRWWENSSTTTPPSGFARWIAIRQDFGPVDGYIPTKDLPTDSYPSDGDSYTGNPNCLDPSFQTAAQTLSDRIKAYGAKSADVIEWVRGQDAVFSNCPGKGKRPNYPGQQAPSTLPPHFPQALPNAAQWLRYDRAYQIAAARFYYLDFDAAGAGFHTIAADPASPWSVLSRYLEARVLIRQAQSTDQNASHEWTEARSELLTMRTEPRMASMRSAIDDMINLISASIEPAHEEILVAERLDNPQDPRFAQDLRDLTALRSWAQYDSSGKLAAQRKAARAAAFRSHEERTGADMLDWIDTLQSTDPDLNSVDELSLPSAESTKKEAAIRETARSQAAAVSLRKWHETHSTPWLLAALMFAKPDDPNLADLLAAAKAIPPGSPGFTAIAYHRLRLSPKDAETRNDLLALLPSIEAREGRSATNLFAALNAATAPDFETWLRQAGRQPASEWIESSEDGPYGTTYAGEVADPVNDDQHHHGNPKPTPYLFTDDAATILNTRLPLHLLIHAAEDQDLAPNLRTQLAIAAWTRAVLLNRPEDAKHLTPLLIASNKDWQAVLIPYDQATTDNDRKAYGLLALMRFPRTEPNVREGSERLQGTYTYSEYRDNWWSATISPDPLVDTADDIASANTFSHREIPDPLFLTAQDREETGQETAALKKIPTAADYFTSEALAWQKAHPRDPRSPELLGEAFRVVRNASDGKPDDERSLFLALHKNYPGNHWTLRYKSWSRPEAD